MDIISVSDLYRVGRVGETKLPLTDVVISVASKLYRVPTGMTVREAFAASALHTTRNKIILGGPMCGTALLIWKQAFRKTARPSLLSPKISSPK